MGLNPPVLALPPLPLVVSLPVPFPLDPITLPRLPLPAGPNAPTPTGLVAPDVSPLVAASRPAPEPLLRGLAPCWNDARGLDVSDRSTVEDEACSATLLRLGIDAAGCDPTKDERMSCIHEKKTVSERSANAARTRTLRSPRTSH